MSNADLRTALVIGWLVQRIAELQRRTLAQVAADLFEYLDTIDTETQWRG